MHQSRFSVEGVLDAPDSSAARPGLRLRVAAVVVAALFGVLALRLWTLQVLQAPAATQAVAANQIRAVSIQPTRGLILDRYANPLVDNVAVNTITLSRSAATQYPMVVGRLAALIGQSVAQVKATIADNQNSIYEPVPVLPNATPTQILYVKEHPSEFPGVSTATTTERNYPQLQYPNASGYPAAQTLGYVGAISAAELKADAAHGYQAGDAYGQTGLEQQYQSQLRGVPGLQQLEVDSQGQVVGTLVSKAAVPGDNIVTSLDLPLQQVADNALATQILSLRKTFDPACNNGSGCLPAATSGAVVVMDPRTGAVLAMSSYPSYNPSVWVGGITNAAYAALNANSANQPLTNRVIQGTYTPGSTFKLNTATAALNSGLWTGSETYDDKNTFTVPGCVANSGATGCVLHNAAGDTGGILNISQALTVSSDDFFYNLGAQFYVDYLATGAYGPTPIQNTAAQYSLGELTGIDLPAEYAGRVDSQAVRQKLHAMSPTGFPNTSWYTGDNVEMAFGQGATIITPIEQAVAYSTFANGGTRYAPQVAAAVVSPTGRLVKQFTPQVTGHVSLPPSTYQPMLAGFEGVVQNPSGTAYGSFQGSTWPVSDLAGKTGTADTVPGKEPTAWFVGFTPNPQFVVVCVIDQAGYGAQAAAPVVRTIYDYLYNHPVGPVALNPSQSVVQSSKPVPLSTTTTAPTTTAPTTTAPTTTAPTTTAPRG
jgi:penicillin-binding protein 2